MWTEFEQDWSHSDRVALGSLETCGITVVIIGRKFKLVLHNAGRSLRRLHGKCRLPRYDGNNFYMGRGTGIYTGMVRGGQ